MLEEKKEISTVTDRLEASAYIFTPIMIATFLFLNMNISVTKWWVIGTLALMGMVTIWKIFTSKGDLIFYELAQYRIILIINVCITFGFVLFMPTRTDVIVLCISGLYSVFNISKLQKDMSFVM